MFDYFKLTAWAVFWFVMWILFAVVRKGRDNCLTWALRKQQKEGGYLVIRWCRTNRIKWLKWPHFLYLSNEHNEVLQHYIPVRDEKKRKYFPHPWFEGRIKQSDSEDGEEN